MVGKYSKVARKLVTFLFYMSMDYFYFSSYVDFHFFILDSRLKLT
jgi:hypothetical protein